MSSDQRRERRRASAPDVRATWGVLAVVAVVCLIGNPVGTAPGLLLIGVCVWAWLRKRTREHAVWVAEQSAASMPSPALASARALAFERAGMPESARAMRDLHAG